MKIKNTFKTIVAGAIIAGLTLGLTACGGGGGGGGDKPPGPGPGPGPVPGHATTTLQVTNLHFTDKHK